jgi:hypothetical protein
MSHRSRVFAVTMGALAVLTLAGCAPPSPTSAPAGLISPGEGPEVVRRILLSPGDVRSYDSGNVSFFGNRVDRTLGETSVEGHRVIAVRRHSYAQADAELAERPPTAEAVGYTDIVYHELRDDGLYVWGSARRGVLEAPILQVQLPLRLGTEWLTAAQEDGMPAYHFKCEAVMEVEVKAGRFRVAVVRQTDLRSPRDAEIWWADGIGRVRSRTFDRQSVRDGKAVSDVQLEDYILPSEGAEP